MARNLLGQLTAWLEAGANQIGEISIEQKNDGWELRHIADAERSDLTLHTSPHDARHIANLDEAGAFRPLKTAPNLRRGWRLTVRDIAELRVALDGFYPAMCGVLASWRAGELAVIPLRATLERQTGMYAVTKKLTDDEARELTTATCAKSACLKRTLWADPSALPGEKRTASANASEIPMLCHEACNLLVAAARTVVKSRPSVS